MPRRASIRSAISVSSLAPNNSAVPSAADIKSTNASPRARGPTRDGCGRVPQVRYLNLGLGVAVSSRPISANRPSHLAKGPVRNRATLFLVNTKVRLIEERETANLGIGGNKQ
jgi:hypothetical protein